MDKNYLFQRELLVADKGHRTTNHSSWIHKIIYPSSWTHRNIKSSTGNTPFHDVAKREGKAAVRSTESELFSYLGLVALTHVFSVILIPHFFEKI